MRRALLTFAISVALLAAFVVLVGPATLALQLAETNLGVFALGLVAMTGALVAWSEGLRPLLTASDVTVSRWRLLVAYTAAMLGRQVLPLGAIGGPAVTAYTVDREVDLGYDESLAVVAVAEFLSTVASLTIAAIGALVLLGEVVAVPQLRIVVYASGVFTVVLVGLGVAFLTERAVVARLVATGTRLLHTIVAQVSTQLAAPIEVSRAAAALDRFYARVDALRGDGRTLLIVFGLHAGGWLLASLPLYTSALALGVTIPFPLVVLLVATSGLVDILPLPGGLGGVEIVLATLIATISSVTLPIAAAVVLLYRICSYWYLVLLGAVASAYTAAGVVTHRPPEEI